METVLNQTNVPVIWVIQNTLIVPIYVYHLVLGVVLTAYVQHQILVHVILDSLRTQNIEISVYQSVKMVV
jgi:hypothetical protein